MPIQHLDINRQKKEQPKFGESFSQAIMAMQEQKQKEQTNKSIKEQFGFDPTGMSDKQIEIGMQLAGQAKNKENEIEFKHKKRQELLKDIRGNKGQSFGDQVMNNGQQNFDQNGISLEESPEFYLNKSEEAAAIGEHDLSQHYGKRATELAKESRAKKQEVTESFKENKDYINKVYDQYEDAERRESIFERMDQLEESGELSDSGIINVLESLGMKPEWLKNPANEEYTKLGLDLLGGGTLQADYGSRVLASEFMVSQKRIPTLSQTPEGRKQIKENIKTLLLPAKLKKERLQYYLDRQERTGKPLPHNIRGKILNDIKPQLEEAYDAFKQRNGRYKVKNGTQPDDNAIEKYYYIADSNEDKALKMMIEDGYVVD